MKKEIYQMSSDEALNESIKLELKTAYKRQEMLAKEQMKNYEKYTIY